MSGMTPIDIAASGLAAQAARMRAISNNIANAQTTNAGDGSPYRRLEVALTAGEGEMGGVEILGTEQDVETEFPKVLMAGHPDADAKGYVTMPNVSVPQEMMSMITASGAYEASAAVMKLYS